MNQTILVVDDSPTMVKFVSFWLRHTDIEVVAASDGMDAIEKIATSDRADVSLVITDLEHAQH